MCIRDSLGAHALPCLIVQQQKKLPVARFKLHIGHGLEGFGFLLEGDTFVVAYSLDSVQHLIGSGNLLAARSASWFVDIRHTALGILASLFGQAIADILDGLWRPDIRRADLAGL